MILLRAQHACDSVVHNPIFPSFFLLVEQDNVRKPDVLRGNIEGLDTAVILRVPLELVILPGLLNPNVGSHHLVLEVLISGEMSVCI